MIKCNIDIKTNICKDIIIKENVKTTVTCCGYDIYVGNNVNITIQNILIRDKLLKIKFKIGAFASIDNNDKKNNAHNDYIDLYINEKYYRLIRKDYISNEMYIMDTDKVFYGTFVDYYLPNQKHIGRSCIFDINFDYLVETNHIDIKINMVKDQEYEDEAWGYIINSCNIETKDGNCKTAHI